MYRPRLIPVIQLDGCHACKTIQFKQKIDLGDPVNLVSIFSAFCIDEIVVLDIAATRSHRSFDLGLFREIASEAQMPFSFGGGIKTLDQILSLLSLGAERVILSSVIHDNPSLVATAVQSFGSSSISACLDIGSDWLGRPAVYDNSGKRKQSGSPLEVAKRVEHLGVGEIIVQSIPRDGMMGGFDIPLLARVSEALRVPVVALGGAGCLGHMLDTYLATEVSAFASGSFFIFKGPSKGVLPSYPNLDDLSLFTERGSVSAI